MILNGHQIGNIDIFDNFSFVEIPNANASDFYRFMGETYIANKRVHIEPARPREKSNRKNNENKFKIFLKKVLTYPHCYDNISRQCGIFMSRNYIGGNCYVYLYA